MSLPELNRGDVIEDYTLQDPLGKGSFGVVHSQTIQVFKAKSNKYGTVALKAMLKIRFKEHNGFLGKLVENERTALSLLNSDHVIKLYDYFETRDFAIFILEYCEGGTLDEYWQKNQCVIPQFQALIFFKQLLKGMKTLHKQKIIHRDLKMANILLHRDVLKIADLGFCHLLKNQDDLAVGNLGSTGTMAPETIEGKPYGLQADMFAVGVILYQMIFSKFPFNSANKYTFLNDVKNESICKAYITLDPPKFKLKSQDVVDQNIKDLLSNMLKYDPKQRLKWSDLFSNQIFMGQSSMSIIKDHTQYLADIDAQKNKLFYKNAEENEKQYETQNPINDEQILNEILKTNDKFQDLLSQSKKKSNKPKMNSYNQQIENQKLQQSEILVQEQNKIDLKEIDIINKYIKAKQPISCLSIIYNDMKQFRHKQVFDCIFVSYILIKQIYYSHYKLRAEIKQNKFFPQLIQQQTFKTFMKEFDEENEFLSIHLSFEYQTVQANLKKLEKYLKPNWTCEASELSQTQKFQDIYREVLQNYLNIIAKEELKQQGEPNPERLRYIAMVINILDYEELITINDIDKGIAGIKNRDINELIQFIQNSIQ
ncbi:unnamed protein product (macronuclear) [Paramecium tetraurelia]|uniref:Protein kinase domain-containing protein n=1 Tax=Paramecium tetraurelia TaxID=5888 RepID=A0E6E0_PARTE|nr:uncharacterized protein GSPATT00003722001 [Paramecium tetraurelia]CAK90857.1 unnamed protein product [Paramecium tetraurelia]|eukprot:XP_001458254.1 hypothetical protein (macronuclear) [Paramecium tetraurelia strain d4-2]